ncbi:MaoC family dehydratase N-terminal domain-containing protein [Mycobacterium sp. CVI_P3]|uniref:MaoC family dehydratase N-terminal domain-containing protein n=1 Tax=Mycobacterium pinniadriaticum TaxID=2994102 RepID=A0ABT3SAF2_9MYCO|nr:MaoC family dehydratase N-terminal domain-containing protein [Mycobacterium pinniadriaticum]MCX2929881.1 MaoC family dehydratase N-terminal domain-containing protein [Mycobacterium pinniadriaticum]MCX2936470.1 MaoC family dehydratase N-terminal domain-containing protein [Mycobacterium pinniadriaticum]
MSHDTDIDEKSQRFSLITERALDDLRSMIGVKIAQTVEPWCYEVTRDNIRHYAHGIGDDNPLWCDVDYAAQSRYGTLLAPPSFVFALNRIYSGYVGGLPGVHAMWSGASTTWHRHLRRGDEIHTEAYLKDLVEHQTAFAGRAIQQIYHVDFYSDGELVAEGDSWCFRTERDTARERGKYQSAREVEPRYDYDDIAAVAQAYREEKPRGADPLYVDEVAVGDVLPVMTKGPMTVTGFIAYAQGWGGLYIRANRLAHKQLEKHPNLGIADRFGIPDVPERVHWDDDLARMVGTPRAYDYGPERASWLTHHITDWMGDHGFLVSHSSQIRRHNPTGDIVKISGTVSHVDREDGLVTVEQTARQQDGELSARGTAVVRLPLRPTP